MGVRRVTESPLLLYAERKMNIRDIFVSWRRKWKCRCRRSKVEFEKRSDTHIYLFPLLYLLTALFLLFPPPSYLFRFFIKSDSFVLHLVRQCSNYMIILVDVITIMPSLFLHFPLPCGTWASPWTAS